MLLRTVWPELKRKCRLWRWHTNWNEHKCVEKKKKKTLKEQYQVPLLFLYSKMATTKFSAMAHKHVHKHIQPAVDLTATVTTCTINHNIASKKKEKHMTFKVCDRSINLHVIASVIFWATQYGIVVSSTAAKWTEIQSAVSESPP